jgi:hypothetical protein
LPSWWTGAYKEEMTLLHVAGFLRWHICRGFHRRR